MKIANALVIKFGIACIRLYQWCVSPWLGTCCRYSPSCSHYAVEALSTHGAIKGSFLTARRLLRCNPFGHSGYDPVPPLSKK
jgi:putative membrane protein insertion efficiency factor